jgi:hypothetical protein
MNRFSHTRVQRQTIRTERGRPLRVSLRPLHAAALVACGFAPSVLAPPLPGR